jgi:hypothetical protein
MQQVSVIGSRHVQGTSNWRAAQLQNKTFVGNERGGCNSHLEGSLLICRLLMSKPNVQKLEPAMLAMQHTKSLAGLTGTGQAQGHDLSLDTNWKELHQQAASTWCDMPFGAHNAPLRCSWQASAMLCGC